MPNGKPGDHPLTDVLHGSRVYSECADALVREIHAAADERGRAELVRFLEKHDPWSRPDIAQLERALVEMRARIQRERG